MLFRFRYIEMGAHTHVKLFCGIGTGSLGKCGDLVFRNEEWKFLKDGIERTIGIEKGIGHNIEFVEEKR